MTDKEESRLLELPDSCLLSVLQHAADDLQSLYSAARAHSKLRETAAQALRSISVEQRQQQQTTSLLLYLAQHGQHVESLTLELEEASQWEPSVDDLQLPAKMQLRSLHLTGFELQLQPGNGSPGMLGTVLKQLQLADCAVVDGQAGLASAVMQLPGLEHLSLARTHYHATAYYAFPASADARAHEPTMASVLRTLQHLTYLELDNFLGTRAPDKDQPY